jgi:hypothetical protein
LAENSLSARDQGLFNVGFNICHMNQNEIAYKSLPDSHIKKMHDYWKPGRVIFNDYWRSYDLILEFHEVPFEHLMGITWSVDVVACDKYGLVSKGTESRNHCTQPGERDKIIRDI